MLKITILIILIQNINIIVNSDKVTNEILNNYSTFLNFGDKKLNKLNRSNFENEIFKSKVDVLGEIFKNNIDALKITGNLDLVFLIDASSSIGEQNFKSELKFVKKLMSDITVDYNHTRVAIITFSSSESVAISVDEISNVSTENNKCLLLNKQLNNIKYTGGGTYTLGAFQKAKEIFQNSRNDSKKVLFLITDGFSNGGDPVPLAQELKENHTTIFTIGIQSGNYRELYNLSTSPGELYSYLLDSFEEFESLARRALHVDLQSGEYIPLATDTACNDLCNNTNCCDKKALCTCGTTTGHYSCLCQPGYYGSGLQNSCLPCPSGSYASGPNLCLPCPDLHHVTIPPANGINSCKCSKGYQSTKDYKCEVLKCPKQNAPKHGYFVKRKECDNVLNTACGVRCNVGYTLTGSSIRLCQENGTWSGDNPFCQVKTCESLATPLYGSISCKHFDLDVTYNESDTAFPIDTVCTFTCEEGRTLVGSVQRTCLPLAQWDGLRTSCRQIKCNKLSQIRYGTIEPASCTIGKQQFGKKCTYSCQEGFNISGPSEKSCVGQHGTWQPADEPTICKDATPPVLKCPGNLTVNTRKGKKFGTTVWKEPKVTDNSGLNLTLWLKPAIKNITNFKFSIGKTTVTYYAQDPSGNRAECKFFVEVIDNESPVIEDCESPLIYLSTDKNGANITWDEPYIYDNSQKVKIIKSHDFGFFPLGTTIVTYTAIDSSNNNNTCLLNITVEEGHCDILPDPIYGHSECSQGIDGISCVITCQEGYAVPLGAPSSSSNIYDLDALNFYCNDSEAMWFNPQGLMFPECSVTEIPTEFEQNGVITIKKDSNLDDEWCNNLKKRKEFENVIENTIENNLQDECINGSCKLNVKSYCEDNNEENSEYEERTNIINKRDIQQQNNNKTKQHKNKRVNVQFKIVQRGQSRNNFEKKMHNIKFPIANISAAYVLNFEEVKAICPKGYAIRRNKCVRCPKGTFYNATRNTCESCPIGFYNNQHAQTVCTPCPKNFSTKRLRIKSKEGCIEQCPSGTHARKKIIKRIRNNETIIFERATLKPFCRSCPIGTYQNNYGHFRCIRCPEGFTTLTTRSNSSSLCIPKDICSNSSNTCKNGYCVVDSEFYYSCNCHKNYIGTHCETLIDSCKSNPCLNDGVCSPLLPSDYKCTCKKGYSGKNCQDVDDSCTEINCTNNGICVQNDSDEYMCLCPNGYGGKYCEIKLNYCKSNLCENNGKCIEQLNGYLCVCEMGYIGKRCNILPCDYQPCNGNSICINLPQQNATRNSYKCECLDGYKGSNCDQKINYCDTNPCKNNGNCISNSTNYTCHCPKAFFGNNCEMKKNSSYILNFIKTDTRNRVRVKGFENNLTEISACLWMQSSDNFNYGTLLSYATIQYDNAFTLTDYTGLVFYVNNQYIISDVNLNDGYWHHVCVTWKSKEGSYAIYVDGYIKRSGNNLAPNTQIQGRGNLIIGQEQDILGGKFSLAESFIGKVTSVDVWSKFFNYDEIMQNMYDCNDNIYGDLYAWPDIQDYVEGDIKIENSDFCKTCSNPKLMLNGFVNVVDNVAYYKCNRGFKINDVKYSLGRKCTKSTKWEGKYEPYCKKIICGYPDYIRNGYIIGRKYFYKDKIYFKCYEGYNLIGSHSQICKEDGKWYPEKPICQGPHCKAFKKNYQYTHINIISDQLYEDFNQNKSIFDIGIQIEFTCPENSELQGINIITCQENGTWDYEPPKCIKKTNNLPCSLKQLPQAPPNGYIIEETLNAYGNNTADTVHYKCRPGYKLRGDNFTSCILDGYWTEVNISCDPIMCRSPPKPKNMLIKHENLTNGSFLFGNMVTYECADGYRMFGNNVIRCMANGKWSRVGAKCTRKSCHKPVVSPDTIVTGNSYLFEDRVTLTCPNEKEYILICDKMGKWIGDRHESC